MLADLSADVRFSLASEPDTAKAVQQINEGFAHRDWHDRFVTMIAAVIRHAKSGEPMRRCVAIAPLPWAIINGATRLVRSTIPNTFVANKPRIRCMSIEPISAG